MSTELDLERVARLLTQSSRQLDAQTLSALSNARRIALERQQAQAPVFAFSPASALGTAHWTHRLIPHTAHQWIAAGLIVAAIASGAGFWHHAQEQQIGDLDVAILTDELPIEVFVD